MTFLKRWQFNLYLRTFSQKLSVMMMFAVEEMTGSDQFQSRADLCPHADHLDCSTLTTCHWIITHWVILNPCLSIPIPIPSQSQSCSTLTTCQWIITHSLCLSPAVQMSILMIRMTMPLFVSPLHWITCSMPKITPGGNSSLTIWKKLESHHETKTLRWEREGEIWVDFDDPGEVNVRLQKAKRMAKCSLF